MTKLNLTADNFTVTAGGETRVINPADLHVDTVAAIFVYGARRWFQDYVNSTVHATMTAAAKAAKEAGESFDAEAFRATIDVAEIMEARMEAARTGDFNVRGDGGESFTELENAVYDVAADMKKAKPIAAAFKAAKGESTAKRKRLVIDAVYGMSDDAVKAIESAAKAAIKRRNDLAAALGELG